jgi:hypothetical protein
VLVEDEVEQHVPLVAALVAEEAALLLRGLVGLGEQDGVAAAAVEEGPQAEQEVVGSWPRSASVPASSITNGAASTRKPDSPSSSQ